MGMITEEEKIKTRANILEVSKKMFIEKGFEKTNIKSIANKIGIGVSTIYGYFASKQDLFTAAFFSDFKRVEELHYEIKSLDYASLNLDNLSELLTFLIMLYFEKIDKMDRGILKQFYGSLYSEETEEKDKAKLPWEEAVRNKIKKVLKHCEEHNLFLVPVSLEEAADIIYMIQEYQMKEYLLDRFITKEIIRKNIKRLIKSFLSGKVKERNSYDEFIKMLNKLDFN